MPVKDASGPITSETHTVYNPGEIIGGTLPNLAAPPPKKSGCSGILKILVVIVAVVVTIYTAGAASGLVGATTGGFTATMGAGMAALSGTAITGVSTAGLLASAAIGGAVGSIASQGVAMAVGLQDSFNWSGVALSALGAGVASGVGNMAKVFATGTLGAMQAAATANAVTQGVSVVTGLQDKFNWRSVAASAAAAGVASTVGDAVRKVDLGTLSSDALGRDWVSNIVRQSVTNVASGVVQQLVMNGRVDWHGLALSSVGSAIGSEAAEYAKADAAQTEASVRESRRLELLKNSQGGGIKVDTSAAALSERNGQIQQVIDELDGAARQYGGYDNIPTNSAPMQAALVLGNGNSPTLQALAESSDVQSDADLGATQTNSAADNRAAGLKLPTGTRYLVEPEQSDRLLLSSGPGDEDQYTPQAKVRRMASELNQMIVDFTERKGGSLSPTIENAAALGLWDTSGDGYPQKSNSNSVPPVFGSLADFANPVSEVLYRGMSVAQFRAAEANMGGFETWGKTGYMSPALDYILGLEAGTANPKLDFSVKVKYELGGDGMQTIRNDAYVENSKTARLFPNNEYLSHGIDAEEIFTLKAETVTGVNRGGRGIAIDLPTEGQTAINLGVGKNRTGDIRENILNWEVVDSTSPEVSVGTSGVGVLGKDFRTAQRISTFGKGLGFGLGAYAAYQDYQSLSGEFATSQKTGTYSNTWNEAGRVAGGWAGASFGVGFGSAFGPIGTAVGGLAGGLIGSGLGYWGGSAAGPRIINDLSNSWSSTKAWFYGPQRK